MSESHKFLTHLKNNELFKALDVVVTHSSKELRVRKTMELLKSSSMSTYVVAIRQFEELLEDHSKDKKKLELEVAKINSANPGDWHGRLFASARSNVLYDVMYDNPHCTFEAIKAIISTYSQRGVEATETLFKSFLANMAAETWPESSLIGAIYG